MKYKIETAEVEISRLRPHEAVDPKRLEVVRDALTPPFENLEHPIVADNKMFIILDGHHRTKVMKELGHETIPVVLVNYFDDRLVLEWRRPEYEILDKMDVIHNVKSGKLYPPKTARWMWRTWMGDLIPLVKVLTDEYHKKEI